MGKKYYDLETMNDKIIGVMHLIIAFGYRIEHDFLNRDSAQAMYLLEHQLRDIREELKQIVDQGSGLIEIIKKNDG